MVDSGIRTRHLRRPNRGDSRHMYYASYQLCRPKLCASWAISGKGKNADYWIEYFPFEKFFRRKIKLNIFLSKKNFWTESNKFKQIQSFSSAFYSQTVYALYSYSTRESKVLINNLLYDSLLLGLVVWSEKISLHWPASATSAVFSMGSRLSFVWAIFQFVG